MLQKWSVVTSALKRIVIHGPIGKFSLCFTDIENEIVKIMRKKIFFSHIACAPFSMFISSSGPDSRWIGHFFD
ncbi:hypothetical protein D3C85_1144470 [compost metagenome]